MSVKLKAKTYRFKMSEGFALPTKLKLVLKVDVTNRVYNEKGELVDEEYEVTVLEE